MFIHKPVLLDEVMGLLNEHEEDLLFVDATLGEGGHAEAFLSRNPRLILYGIEKDQSIMERARKRLKRFSPRVKLFRMDFYEFFRTVSELVDRSPKRIFFMGVMTWINSIHYAHTPGPRSIERRCQVFTCVDPGPILAAAYPERPGTTRPGG